MTLFKQRLTTNRTHNRTKSKKTKTPKFKSKGSRNKVSKNKNIPIPENVRNRLSKKSDCYRHNNQQHKDNIPILEYQCEIIEWNHITLGDFLSNNFYFESYKQIDFGIEITLTSNTDDSELYIKINMLPNAERHYSIYYGQSCLLDLKVDCPLSIYFPDDEIDL